MVRKLLKSLLDMFPYFFSKSPESNFYKSQSVTSERFKDLYNSLLDTYLSFNLDKKCIIYKEQDSDHDYVMHFLCSIPLLESVKIFMESHLIYEANFELCSDESYSFMVEEIFHNWEEVIDEEEQSSFVDNIYSQEHTIAENIISIDYSYNQTSENIIPDTPYSITVTTFDEYTVSKGFPENDTFQGDIYDHDLSLDEIGALTNIPRKKYIETTNYSQTEPPYNDRSTEDDYHYMNRMLQYILLIHQKPLVVAEIFKLYGVNAELLNRDRLLVRMFDIFEHSYYYDEDSDGDQLFVDDWIPEIWEHKDQLCECPINLGEYFYVYPNTLQPIKKQPVIFYFEFLNSLAENLVGDFTVDIYLNGNLIKENHDSNQYSVDLSLLDDVGENIFTFEAKKFNEIFSVETLSIHVRGCDDADFYVSNNGSDDNDGSKYAPFKTLEKAVLSVNGIYNLIAILGSIETRGKIQIDESCAIIGCNNAEIINSENSVFFNVSQNQQLVLQDLKITTNEPFTTVIDNEVFTNENNLSEVETVLNYNMDNGVLINDLCNEFFIKNIDFNEETGILTWNELTHNEFNMLNELKGVICNIELKSDDDVYYEEYIPVTTSEKLLNMKFVYFEDRKELKDAVQDLTYDNSNGVLTLDLCGDEIIWQAKSHSI